MGHGSSTGSLRLYSLRLNDTRTPVTCQVPYTCLFGRLQPLTMFLRRALAVLSLLAVSAMAQDACPAGISLLFKGNPEVWRMCSVEFAHKQVASRRFLLLPI